MLSTESKSSETADAMLREIYEQPHAIGATLDAYVDGSEIRDETLCRVRDVIGGHERLVIAASGSSRHAGLAGEIMLEDLAGIPVDVEYASEYCYRSTHTLQDPAVITISQSGETADTLAALRVANGLGRRTLAITNVAESTITREADASLPTMAGKEYAIPATKSFTTQLAVLYILTLCSARVRGRMSPEDCRRHIGELRSIPALLEAALAGWDQQIAGLAASYASAQSLIYLGRSIHYSIAREGALKLKESAYVPAEGYPAGEVKHGPNALVSENVPIVAIATRDLEDGPSMLRYERSLQLLRDLKAQGAQLLALVSEGDEEIGSIATHTIAVPRASEYLLPILEVVPLQLFAYYCAKANGIDTGSLRNLVKAVVRE